MPERGDPNMDHVEGNEIGREATGTSAEQSRKPLSRRQFLTRAGAVGLGIPLVRASGMFDLASARTPARAGRVLRGEAASSGAASLKGIVVGLATDIDTLDPISFRSDAAYEAVIQAYQEPVDNKVVAVKGVLEGVPGSLVGIVASKFSISPDATVYKFTVRDGAKFSNGQPVTAKALYYSYLRALEGPGYASLLMTLLTVKHPSQLVVTGPKTFEIHLSQPNPMGPKLIPLSVLVVYTPTYSKSHATKSDPWATKWYTGHMMGTGAYVQTSTWESGNQYLLAPNPHAWDRGQMRNSGVLLKYLPDSDDRALLVKNGSIDVAFGLPASKLHSLRNTSSVRLINTPTRNWNFLGMNTTMKPFDDVRVRQAVAYALPYDELIKDALYGFASPLRGILSTGTPTLDTSLWPYKTNISKAKRLLAEAGLPKGFSSTLTVSVSRPNDVTSATYIQASLAKVGIDVAISQASTANFRTKEDTGELPMFIDYWYSWVDDPFYQMFWLLSSKNVGAGGTNLAKFKDPAMDSLISKGFYESTAAERDRLSRQAQSLYAEQVPYVPLYSENFTLAVGKDVRGVNVWPDDYVRFWLLSK